MKFVDKDTQADFDAIPIERRMKFRNDWYARNYPQIKRVLKVKEWLKMKKEEKYWNDNYGHQEPNIIAGTIKFEIIDGKVKTTFVSYKDEDKGIKS